MLRVFLYAVVLYAGLGFSYFALAQSIPATSGPSPFVLYYTSNSGLTSWDSPAGVCPQNSVFQRNSTPFPTVYNGQSVVGSCVGQYSTYNSIATLRCAAGQFPVSQSGQVVGCTPTVYNCPSGYTLNGTMCDPVNNCANRPDEGQGGWYTSPVGSPASGAYCSGGCEMNLVTDLSAGEYFTDGTTATFYLKKSYTGQSCTSDNAPSPDNPSPTNKTNPPCQPGHGVMTSSTGKISCVPPGTPGSNEPIIKKEEVITTGPNGETIRKDKTTIRDPKTGVETTTETIETCNGGSCSTSSSSSSSSSTKGGDPTKPVGGDADKGDGDDKNFCQENPDLQICKGGMNEEETQKKVEGHLDEIKKSLNPEEDGPDTGLADEKAAYDQKANEHKAVFDNIGANPSADPHGMLDWAFIPTVPQTSCTPLSGAFMGRSITFDWCTQLNMIRDLAGYAFYILTAFGLFRIVSGAHGGNS